MQRVEIKLGKEGYNLLEETKWNGGVEDLRIWAWSWKPKAEKCKNFLSFFFFSFSLSSWWWWADGFGEWNGGFYRDRGLRYQGRRGGGGAMMVGEW